MEQVNWGIIGCGDVTEIKSGPAFNKVPDSKLVAVMRRNETLAADYAARHGVSTWYSSATELINDPRINAVYIATPPSSHKEYCLQALASGKNVYVEKPMAINAAEANEMVAFAEERGLKLCVAHYRREQPKFKLIKALLTEGAIGKPQTARILFTRPLLTDESLKLPAKAWRVDPAVSGGGLFHDLAPHQLDLLLYFFGEAEEASGISCNHAGKYAGADMVAGTIRFKSGVVFSGSWDFAYFKYGEDIMELTGSAGRISFAVFDHTRFILETATGTREYRFEPLEHVQQPLIEKIVAFFLGRGENPSSGMNGLQAIQLIDAFSR